MAVEYICDGCGKREPAAMTDDGRPMKPWNWFGRHDKDGQQVACSRGCIDKVSAATGKTALVLPI